MRRIPACVAAVLLISLASVAWGQGRFPLKAEAFPGRFDGLCERVGAYLQAAKEKPALKGMPKGLGAEPWFFSARLLGKNVVFAVSIGMQPRAWVDTNADGDLSDETPLAGRDAGEGWNNYRAISFGPLTVRAGGREVTLAARACEERNGRSCTLSLDPWNVMTATVRLDDRDRRVALVDGDLDGKYAPFEPSASLENMDVLAIDLNGNGTLGRWDEKDEGLPLPRLVRVGDGWYNVRAAEDGSWIEFEKTEPGFGRLNVGNIGAELEVIGDSGIYRLSGVDGKWRLPEGRYVIHGVTLRREDARGEWLLTRPWGQREAQAHAVFSIADGQTTSVRLGAPFAVLVRVDVAEKVVVMKLLMRGQSGESYEPRGVGGAACLPETKCSIFDEAGKELNSGLFSYG